MKLVSAALASLLLIPATLTAQDTLSTVRFPNSGAPAAQEPFLRGLTLLFSLEYDEAAFAFREAQGADRNFAMAYWGQALTHARINANLDQEPIPVRMILGNLGSTREARIHKAKTPRERLYGEAVEALFAPAGLAPRLTAYIKALRKLTEKYPDDLEARALLAIALLLPGGRDYRGDPAQRAGEAITLARSIFEQQPDHPSAHSFRKLGIWEKIVKQPER